MMNKWLLSRGYSRLTLRSDSNTPWALQANLTMVPASESRRIAATRPEACSASKAK